MFWNRSFLIFTLLICACSSTSVTSINPAQSPKPLTLLISIDGFKPEYLQKEVAPNLFKLAQNGATTKGMLPVFPSVTFPNHFSMVTGLYPDHHGIVNNAMKDSQIAEPFRLSSKSAVSNPAWWTDAVPVWVSAQEQGLISSTLFWPGTEAKIKGIQPNDWLVYDKGLRPPARVELLLEWLSRPNPARADFATLYFEDVDSMGHRFGPNSAEVRTAVQQIDTVIGALLQGLEKRNLLSVTTILIVSDHGMAEVTPARRIDLKPLLNDFSRASVEWQGPMAGINLNGDSQDALLLALQKNPQMQCWPKQQIPRKYNYGSHRRIPDIICLANLGYTIVSSSSFMIPGQHGFDPAHPEMHGIFIAAGYRVKNIQLDYFENIEIYPLLCRLLKISPEKNDAKDILFEQIIKR